jgi:primosomal protein N'
MRDVENKSRRGLMKNWARREAAQLTSAHLREWLAGAPKRKGSVRLEIDIDPQSFY